MKIEGRHYRTVWLAADGEALEIIDQSLLPHYFAIARLATLEAAATAIETMQVRGAPCIGATAAYALALAIKRDASDDAISTAAARLARTRPTAVNLHWALREIEAAARAAPQRERAAAAIFRASAIADEDVAACRAIGQHGLALIRAIAANKKGAPVNILTHCNAGWLATVDIGTATAPIYAAHDSGLSVHVYVDETRPRNQGASLTAFELASHNVPHTLIVDNAGGHLMQHGLVDMVIVGSDRMARNGDVANKIGTYLKALAAHDNGVPFYAALPQSTIDWTCQNGVRDIPIEERNEMEVTHMTGATEQGAVSQIRIAPAGVRAANPAFDVTPARLVTGIITERGVAPASEAGLMSLYPERR
jgi:methylthioribose-1-phosphate isomerase